MRAPISVIIPTLNAQSGLPSCLASLMEGLEAGVLREVVVTDGGSTDATRAIADEVGALWVEGPASRGGQLKRGCEAASGEWFLILHADTRLQDGWSAMLPSARGAYYGRLGFDTTGVMPAFVAGWANLRARLFGLPYGDQALLIDRASYRAAGGFQDIPLMEDVAMARALRGALKPWGICVTTSTERYQRQGWLRRGRRNLVLLLRYLAGANPERLARSYRRHDT